MRQSKVAGDKGGGSKDSKLVLVQTRIPRGVARWAMSEVRRTHSGSIAAWMRLRIWELYETGKASAQQGAKDGER